MSKFKIIPFLRNKKDGSGQKEQVFLQTTIPAVIGLEKELKKLKELAGGGNVFDNIISFVKKNYIDRSSAMDLFSNQDARGQKDFAQYPTINHGETLYPASSTGWINSGIEFGPNVNCTGYKYRIDNINGNAVMYFQGYFQIKQECLDAPVGSSGRHFLKLPLNYRLIENKFFSYYMDKNYPATGVFNHSDDRQYINFLDSGGLPVSPYGWQEANWIIPLV